MEPVFPDGLDYVNASYNSVSGMIKSSWKRDGDKLEWKVTVPANTSAVVRIPKMFNAKPVSQEGIHGMNETEDSTIVEIGSGEYVFKSIN